MFVKNMFTVIGVRRMTVTIIKKMLSIMTLQDLKGDLLLKFSQIISEGQGASSNVQF